MPHSARLRSPTKNKSTMRTASNLGRFALLRLALACLLVAALLPSCSRDDMETPSSSSSSSSSGFDDHGGHGNDDPPGDDHGSGHD